MPPPSVVSILRKYGVPEGKAASANRPKKAQGSKVKLCEAEIVEIVLSWRETRGVPKKIRKVLESQEKASYFSNFLKNDIFQAFWDFYGNSPDSSPNL